MDFPISNISRSFLIRTSLPFERCLCRCGFFSFLCCSLSILCVGVSVPWKVRIYVRSGNLGSEPDLIVRTHTWFSREIYEDVCVSAGSNVYTRWLAVEVIRFLIPNLPSIALNLSGCLGPVMNKYFAFNNERGYHPLLLVSFHFSSSFVLFYYLVAISLTSSSYVLVFRFKESVACSSAVGFCVCVYLKTIISCRYRWLYCPRP